MHERPEGAELLAAARDALLLKLLPALPEPLRYEARMVANAMAIASRLAGLPSLTLAADGASLAAMIRRGDFAPGSPRREACAEYLRALARSRAAVSNPKALAR